MSGPEDAVAHRPQGEAPASRLDRPPRRARSTRAEEAERTTGDPRTYGYSQPRLSCDVVLKGGITSGVVQTRAVCELARTSVALPATGSRPTRSAPSRTR